MLALKNKILSFTLHATLLVVEDVFAIMSPITTAIIAHIQAHPLPRGIHQERLLHTFVI